MRREYEPIKDTGDFRQRRQLSAYQLRLMATGLSALEKPVVHGAHAQIRTSAMGQEFTTPGLPFWAKITGKNVDGAGHTCYSFSELWEDGAGVFTVLGNGRSGTAAGASSTNQAYEVHGSTTVPTDGSEITKLWLTYDRLHFEFAYAGGGTMSVGPHWTFGGGSPGTATATLAPDITITWPTADGTWNLGYSSGAPLTVNYNFGTLTFPSTSSSSVAPAAVLVIPTGSSTSTTVQTSMNNSPGQLLCKDKILWQGTTTTPVAYVPTKPADLVVSVPNVPVYDPLTTQQVLPNIIRVDLTNLTLGINTPTTTTEAITVKPPTSTPTTVMRILPTATTQTNLLLTMITSQTASPFIIKDPSGNPLLEAITTTGANLTLQFGITNVVNAAPVSYISLPTATVSGPFTWTPPANTYAMALNSLDKKLAFWDGAAWKYLIPSPLTTKGDLWGYGSVDVRVPVGSDGYLLTANSAQTTGLQYRNLTSVDTSVGITITSGNIDLSVAGGSGITEIDVKDSDGTTWTSTTDPTVLWLDCSAFVVTVSSGVFHIQGTGTAIAAAATDLASVITLANSIRAWLLSVGFCT